MPISGCSSPSVKPYHRTEEAYEPYWQKYNFWHVYNLISEVCREAAAESYPNWTKQKQNDMDEVADCTHAILKQIIYLSHKLEDLNT